MLPVLNRASSLLRTGQRLSKKNHFLRVLKGSELGWAWSNQALDLLVMNGWLAVL